MIINKSGIAIRMSVEDLRVMGRATQGVRLINIKDNDEIAAVAKVMKEEEVVDQEDQVLEIEVSSVEEAGSPIDHKVENEESNTSDTEDQEGENENQE